MATLFQAIEQGDIGQVWKLIQDGADLHEVDPASGMTALALAAEAGSEEMVTLLLGAGADPDRGGLTTPIEAATVEGHVEVARALIGASADVNRPVTEGFTPLMTAAATGNVTLVGMLLDAGARPLLENEFGETAISMAEAEGHEAVVRELKTRRRRQDQANEAAEQAAVEQAATETAAEPPVAAENRDPAPAPGARLDDLDAAPEPDAEVEDLAEAAPEPEAAAEPVHFPWMEAETEDLDPPVTETSEAGSETRPTEPEEGSQDQPPEAADDDEEPLVLSPERAAAFAELREQLGEGSAEGVRRLLDDGRLELDNRDESGRTPLMLAAERGEPELVRLLLDAGADPNLSDRTPSGCCALVYAVHSPSPRRTETIALLAGAGADLDQPCGRHGRTPLMHAAEADVYHETEGTFGFGLATKALIRLGAQLEAKDRHGLTVWHQTKRNALGARTSSAFRRRLHQMLRVLEHAGARPVASHLV